MNENIYIAIAGGAASLIISLVNLLLGFIRSRTNKRNIETLKSIVSQDDTNYYVICDSCGKKIHLRDCEIKIDREDVSWQTATARARELKKIPPQ